MSQIGFVFEGAPDDKETHEVLFEFQSRHPEFFCFDLQINSEERHKKHPDKGRMWSKDEYLKMSRLRNALLDRVEQYAPDRYFSLDSDIILENPDTIRLLHEHTMDTNKKAVSPLCYMFETGNSFPNTMTWDKAPGGNARRRNDIYPIGKVFKTDIIMAAVMMRPEVYRNVRYRFHYKGEDLGWSYECWKRKYDLWLASDIYAAHLMHDHMVESYRLEGDPRSPTV